MFIAVYVCDGEIQQVRTSLLLQPLIDDMIEIADDAFSPETFDYKIYKSGEEDFPVFNIKDFLEERLRSLEKLRKTGS